MLLRGLRQGSVVWDRLAGLAVILGVIVAVLGFLLPPQPEWARELQVEPPPVALEVPRIPQVEPLPPPLPPVPDATLAEPSESSELGCRFGVDQSGRRIACSLRVGLFREAGNVERTLQRLRDAGFSPYTRRLRTRNGALTGIYVGSWYSKAPIQKAKSQIESLLGEKGLVYVRHLPPAAHSEGR